jgi:hypothetical protein
MRFLNVDHLRRCTRTLHSSLALFEQSKGDELLEEVYRNAIVKGYELAQETTFKLLVKALKHYGHGGKKLSETPVKDVLRLAGAHGLMSLDAVERWFRYRDNRNNTAHDYGVNFAEHTLTLLPAFLQDITVLADVLDSKLGPSIDDN